MKRLFCAIGCGHSASVKVFLALLTLVYVSVFPYLQGVNNPNENTRTYLVMALVDHGTFRLDPVVKRYGWTNDMAKVPHPDGTSHLAAVKGPATAYLGVPIYAAQKLVLRLFGEAPPGPEATKEEAQRWLRTTTLTLQFFAVHLPCLAFLFWLERRLRRFSRDDVLRLSAVAAVGLGTNYLAYSFVFVSHALIAVVTFAALDLIATERLRARGEPRRARPSLALLAGLCAGAVTLLEYHAAILSLALGLYALTVFRRPKTLAAFGLGAVVNVLLLMLFQWRSFGSPLTPGHRMMENQAFGALMGQGFISFVRPDPSVPVALFFDSGFGLFGTSPYLWAAFAGAILLALRPYGASALVQREMRREGLMAAGMTLALTLMLSASIIWRGGWTIGPRYLGALPPLVSLLSLIAFEALARSGASLQAQRRRRDLARALAAGLCAASFVQGGAIGLLVSTLPEAITRPVPQILLPLLRLSIVPHHLLELFGVKAAWPYYVVLAAAAGAIVAMATARPESAARLSQRLMIAAATCALVLLPALRLPQGEADRGPEIRAFFYAQWEPSGRDALARAREQVRHDGCAYHQLAKLESILGRQRQSTTAKHLAQAACPEAQ